MEEVLWKACDALRGSIEPSEYKHVVLSLIFLKYAGFHFEKRRQEIIDDGLEDFVNSVEFYAAKNVFYLPETARWAYLKENAKQPNIASVVDKALSDIEKENKPLRGALPNNYYSSLGIEAEKLGSLLDKIDGFDSILASADGNDIIGRDIHNEWCKPSDECGINLSFLYHGRMDRDATDCRGLSVERRHRHRQRRVDWAERNHTARCSYRRWRHHRTRQHRRSRCRAIHNSRG